MRLFIQGFVCAGFCVCEAVWGFVFVCVCVRLFAVGSVRAVGVFVRLCMAGSVCEADCRVVCV